MRLRGQDNLSASVVAGQSEARTDGASHRGQTFTNVHCHCLPGLDDGPATLAEAIALCRSLAADGFDNVVATPHQLGRFDSLYGAQAIREAVKALNLNLKEAQIPMTIMPGADVRLDERIPALIESDDVLTVANGGRYLLLELPHEIFIDPTVLLASLAQAGLSVVITHPERHRFLAQKPDYVQRWTKYRPSLQITAGSFGGGFGLLAKEAAWAFVRQPLPILVATDAHNTTSRAPRMTEAYMLLDRRLGRHVAETVCVENPLRIVRGQELQMLDRQAVLKEVRR